MYNNKHKAEQTHSTCDMTLIMATNNLFNNSVTERGHLQEAEKVSIAGAGCLGEFIPGFVKAALSTAVHLRESFDCNYIRG